MGNQSSSAQSGAQQTEGQAKIDYYELLSVDRQATDDECAIPLLRCKPISRTVLTNIFIAESKRPTERKPSNSIPTGTMETSKTQPNCLPRFSPPMKSFQTPKKEAGTTRIETQYYAARMPVMEVNNSPTMCGLLRRTRFWPCY